MVDRNSISSRFSYDDLRISNRELNKLPETTELLFSEVLSQAKDVSHYYEKCIDDLIDLCDGSVRILFSESVRKRIIAFCKEEKDKDFCNLYESLYYYIHNHHLTEEYLNALAQERLLNVFENKVLPIDIERLKGKAKSLGHFPLYLALDRYLQNAEPLVRDFALETSYIYYSDKVDKPVTPLQGDSLKAFNKLKYQLSKIAPTIRANFINIDSIYKDLLPTEINQLEGTSFSQSFIYWVQWKYGTACYLGESSSKYPSWCFSHRSVEMCFLSDADQISAFKYLYNHIAKVVAKPREIATVEPLEELLYYEEELNDKYVYDESKKHLVKPPPIIRKLNLSESVKGEAERLVHFIGHELSIEGMTLIIPTGEAIDIPIEKKRVQNSIPIPIYSDKAAKQIQTGQIVIEESPIVKRFIIWAKSQDWFSRWADLYQKTCNEDPEIHLHSHGVSRVLNNSIPGRELYEVLYFFQFSFDDFELSEQIKKAENAFITTDRRTAVLSLIEEIDKTNNGLLIKTPKQILEHFGLNPAYVKNVPYCLAGSFNLERLGYAPADYKEHICIYKSFYDEDNLFIASWLWEKRYAVQFSLIKILAQMANATELNEADIQLIDNFLTSQIVEKNARAYLMGSFMAYAIEGPRNYVYDFSILRKEEKEKYLNILEQFVHGYPARYILYKKHKDKIK